MGTAVLEVKQIGLAVAVAVLVDATLVRLLLVPAFMRLAGKLELARAREARPGSSHEVAHRGGDKDLYPARPAPSEPPRLTPESPRALPHRDLPSFDRSVYWATTVARDRCHRS
jgi:hypothetical protein